MVASQTRWSVFWFSQISNGIKCPRQSSKCGEKNASSRQCWKCEMSNCQKAMKDYFLNDRVFLQLSTWWRLLTTRDAGWRGGIPSSGCHHRHHRHRHCKLEYFQLLCCITLLHIAPQYFTHITKHCTVHIAPCIYICDIGICYSRLSAWDTALLWADGIPSRRQLSLDGSTMDQQGWSKNISF